MINKNDLWEYLFGDLVRTMIFQYKLFPGIILSPLLTVIVYQRVIKGHKKGSKYNFKEKIYIGIMIYMWVLSIISQIAMLFLL